jgi:hypothetical protein
VVVQGTVVGYHLQPLLPIERIKCELHTFASSKLYRIFLIRKETIMEVTLPNKGLRLRLGSSSIVIWIVAIKFKV